MRSFYSRLSVVVILLFQFTAIVSAGTLDDYYLQQFGDAKSIQLQKAVLSGTSEVTAQCGMPLKHSLKRDWNLLEQSTQKVLAKQLALPTLSGSEIIVNSSAGHFRIHYTTSGTDAPNIDTINSYTGLGLASANDWANKVGDVFEETYFFYQNQGYHMASTPYDVYLSTPTMFGQLLYGSTNSIDIVPLPGFPNSSSSYIEINKDFSNMIFRSYNPLQNLQITAAHEYHHAIQYSYTFYFDIWYAEATATWMEDELYDNINQLYNYIPAWFSQSKLSLDTAASTTSGGGYGRWIFNRYLSEKHGPTMIRSVWEQAAQKENCTTTNNVKSCSDVPMIPILEDILSSVTFGTSLGNDFFDFAKRVYRRDAWTDHSYDISKIHVYSPITTYAAGTINNAVSSPKPSITLPHYSFAYYKLTPTSGVNSLTIYINKTSGIQTALFKSGNEITANTSGTTTSTSYTASSLGTTDEVVLLIANTTNSDGHEANFSTDGSLVEVTEPTTPSSSVSGGSGCFIATAAYGSYLHPHVQELRHFRDRYLLTNAAGRSFVALYYRCSPPLANFIARHPLLRSMTRMALTPLIAAVIHPRYSVAFLIVFGTAALIIRQRRISKILAHADQAAFHVPSSHI